MEDVEKNVGESEKGVREGERRERKRGYRKWMKNTEKGNGRKRWTRGGGKEVDMGGVEVPGGVEVGGGGVVE